MKKSIFLLISMLVILLSCEKSAFQEDLIGKWEYIASGGGYSGQGATIRLDYMNIGNQNDYSFTRNDTTIEKGTYEIIKNGGNNSSFSGEFNIKFVPKFRIGDGVSQITYRMQTVQIISNDTISLFEGLIDGFNYYFKRK
jgi:hypothetical protein